MKVAVNGIIINTLDIYEIDKITIHTYPTNTVNRFLIHFYNEPGSNCKYLEVKEEGKEVQKLGELRKTLIELWESDKNKILHLEL